MIEALRDTTPTIRAALAASAAVAGFLAWNAAASAVLTWKLGIPDADPLRTWWSYWQAYPLSHPRAGDTLAQMATENVRVRRALLMSAALPTLGAVGLAFRGVQAAWGGVAKRQDDNARWASWSHMRRAGFSGTAGLYLGLLSGRYLRLGTPRQRKHVAIIAPSQSGKGVGFVIPAGLCDPGERVSLVFVDPKFQAFTKTAGWQARIGAKVVLFAPLSETGQTARYNPCAYVRRAPDGSATVDTWGDIQGIVYAQIPEGEGQAAFWNNAARKAYTAVLAFLSESDGAEFTIPAGLDMLMRQDGPAHMRDELDRRRDAGRPYSLPCADNLRDFLSGGEDGEKLRTGIRKTITSELGAFDNPRVRAAVSGNDFDLRQVLRARHAIYIGMDFPDIEKLAPITRLLLQQLVDLNTRGMPGADPAAQFECVVIPDEFTNLGQMDRIKAAFSYAAEYGFRLMPVFQTYAQVEAVYGQKGAASIIDNCKVEVVLGGIKNTDFCKMVSARLGTVRGARRSWTSGGGLAGLADLFRGRVNTSETAQPLITPYGVEHLPDDTALVMHGGSDGCLVKRIRYFDNYRFRMRVLPPPSIPAIEVKLLYDAPRPAPAAQPAPVVVQPAAPPAKAKARPKKGSADLEMSVAQAEATLLAVTRNTVDLAQFGQSPAAAKAQIDRVIHGLPTVKGRK